MLAFEFDYAKMRHSMIKLFAAYFGTAVLAASAWGLLQPHLHRNDWLRLLSTVFLCLVVRQVMVLVEPMAIISSGLKKKTPAIIVDQIGIVANASQFALGQLAWDQQVMAEENFF